MTTFHMRAHDIEFRDHNGQRVVATLCGKQAPEWPLGSLRWKNYVIGKDETEHKVNCVRCFAVRSRLLTAQLADVARDLFELKEAAHEAGRDEVIKLIDQTFTIVGALNQHDTTTSSQDEVEVSA